MAKYLEGFNVDLKQITQIAVNALENVKGENIVVIDTNDISPLFQRIIVCSGNSNRQVSALANHVVEDLKKHGVNIIGVEGRRGGEWVLVDAGDIIIHVMLPKVRDYYEIEQLWQQEVNEN